MNESEISIIDSSALEDFVSKMKISLPTDRICIIPDNYENLSVPEEAIFSGSATTVKKLLIAEGLKADLLDLTNRPWIGDKRGADWFGPVFFVSGSFISQNQDAISIALGIISNYLSTAFGIGRSTDKETNANFKIVVKNEKTGEAKEITYKGPVSGIEKMEAVVKAAAGITEK